MLDENREGWERRVALRTAHGSYLSASMDRVRVVQSAVLTPAALFLETNLDGTAAATHAGPRQLRSIYGACIGVGAAGSGARGATAAAQVECDAESTTWARGQLVL